MKISEEAEEITESIYTAYGSGTGILFGIPSNLHTAVSVIVQLALDAHAERGTTTTEEME